MHFFKKLNAATVGDAIFLKIEKCIRGFETVFGSSDVGCRMSDVGCQLSVVGKTVNGVGEWLMVIFRQAFFIGGFSALVGISRKLLQPACAAALPACPH